MAQSKVVVNDDITPAPLQDDEKEDRSLFGHPSSNNNDKDKITLLAGSTHLLLRGNPAPPPLPTGWHLIPSRTASAGAAGRGYNYYYYFHRETGECRWEYPTAEETTSSSSSSSQVEGMGGLVDAAEVAAAVVTATAASAAAAAAASTSGGDVAPSPPSATVVKKSILKRSSDDPSTTTTSLDNNTTTDNISNNNNNNNEEEEASPSLRNSKRARVDTEPREVRVLHILRKHIHSRRPSSWRVSNITDTKEKAIADLRELQSILSDIADNPKELRATFEEFAKTESDCSSAKRGGDLGFFGRKKMQPAFEKASFSLGVGQMTTDIVDTSSGIHLILRLA